MFFIFVAGSSTGGVMQFEPGHLRLQAVRQKILINFSENNRIDNLYGLWSSTAQVGENLDGGLVRESVALELGAGLGAEQRQVPGRGADQQGAGIGGA